MPVPIRLGCRLMHRNVVLYYIRYRIYMVHRVLSGHGLQFLTRHMTAQPALLWSGVVGASIIVNHMMQPTSACIQKWAIADLIRLSLPCSSGRPCRASSLLKTGQQQQEMLRGSSCGRSGLTIPSSHCGCSPSWSARRTAPSLRRTLDNILPCWLRCQCFRAIYVYI